MGTAVNRILTAPAGALMQRQGDGWVACHAFAATRCEIIQCVREKLV